MRYTIQPFFIPISTLLIFASAFSCDSDKKKDSETTQRSTISIVAGKPMSVFINSDNKLTKEAQELFKGFKPDEDKCSYAHLLNPVLLRVDIGADTSIAPIIEKSGVASSKPVREFKLAASYFEDLVIPERFQKSATLKSDSLYLNFLNSKPIKDSILLFSTDEKIDTLYIQGKSHKVLYDIESIRKRIQSILCSNSKATVALLIDPPSTAVSSQLTISSIQQDCQSGTFTVQTMGGDGSPVIYSVAGLSGGQPSNKLVLPETMRSGKSLTVVAMQTGQRASKQFTTNCTAAVSQEPVKQTSIISRRTVVSRTWTRVAGSNFCVGSCVLAYTERDNLGHTRERRIENYAGCCPANN